MKPSTAQPLPRETSRQRGGRQVRKTRPNLDHRFRRHAGLVLLLQLARPRPWLHSGGDSTVRGPGYDQLRLRRDPLPPGETVGPIRRHQGGTLLRSSRELRMIHPDEGQLARGWRRFLERPDKTYSLVDCLSFVVMEELGIETAITGDRHFRQEGFRVLPQPD